ncbi:MAG TPA: EMC3/TMCO1 family protein [Candidatus Nitrosotalea sp.]|nr:EMC3/TMCO1 family protein [Candidatus Nitrosotalea sp.]
MELAILAFLNTIFLQIPGFSQGPTGSENPWIKGMVESALGIVGIAILLNLFTAVIRRKMVDQSKLKRIMKEVKVWQKERMAAFKSKDQEKIDEVNKKSAYMNKMNMEMMQMNMRPMMITFVPFLLIFYLLLPHLFAPVVALSPIPLDVIPGNFFHLTCTQADLTKTPPVCNHVNELYLWSWYFLSSISMSGIIMRVTKTSMTAD